MAKSEGFIYVASVRKLYYELAIQSAQSLRDLYPEANITLFTHEIWVDDRAEQLFDNIVTNIPINERAKMWCMARTPYDKTFYNDTDSIIAHPDIKKVFNNLGDKILMCQNRMHTVSRTDLMYYDKNRQHEVTYHGAVAWYSKTDLNLEFMQTWFDEYIKQSREEWKYEWADNIWQKFDMFTLWRMTCGLFKEFDRFKDAVGQGHQQYNCTILDGPEKIWSGGRPPTVIQIPRSTFEEFKSYSNITRNLHVSSDFNKQIVASKSIKYN